MMSLPFLLPGPMFLPGGSVSGPMFLSGEVSLTETPPRTVKSGQYASYWNAFLSGNRFRYLENYRSANHC